METAVAVKQDAMPPAVQSESAAIISMIERAARDPAVDVDKFERLMKMQREMKAERAKEAFNTAMAAAQAELPQVVRKAENTQTKSTYATLEAIGAAIDPIITKHGFSQSFGTADSPTAGHYRVTCKTSNHGYEQFDFADVPVDIAGIAGTKNKTPTHAFASTLTYGRRILTMLIFNIKTTKFMPDDDGNAAGAATITDEQIETLQSLAMEVGADLPKFYAYLKIKTLADLPAKDFDRAVQALKAKRARA